MTMRGIESKIASGAFGERAAPEANVPSRFDVSLMNSFTVVVASGPVTDISAPFDLSPSGSTAVTALSIPKVEFVLLGDDLMWL